MKLSLYLRFIFIICVGSSFPTSSHPLDENLVLDIEQGELVTRQSVIDNELQEAQKRRRARYLNSLDDAQHFGLFFKSGIDHIVPMGLDHVLFLLALFLTSIGVKRLCLQITAFTVAHSLTLGLATLSIVVVSGAIVEPLIALSIVWMALAPFINRQSNSAAYATVFVFGLLHGLGFASVLGEFGISPNRFISSLLAFNLGIEFAQLCLLVAMLACTCVALRLALSSQIRGYLNSGIRVMIAIIAGYWLVERLLGF